MPDKRKESGMKILEWYRENKRDLPWRKTKDAYKIWVSEIMLQQTRVETVIDYYQRFLALFPDVWTLAQASEHEVLGAWKGLGYYSRARNLHRAAGEIVKHHGGEFPGTYDEVRRLPGIGDYTAGAILSIAFNQPHPAVDGNVLRVVSRLEGLEEDITGGKARKNVARIVSLMIPHGSAGDFTQGMMELGALVCIPSDPLCDRCPLQALCIAYTEGRQHTLPKRKKGNPPMELAVEVAVIREGGFILMEHRGEETLLAKLWGFPTVEKMAERTAKELFLAKYGLTLKREGVLGKAKHVFSHRIWQMDVGTYRLLKAGTFHPSLHWIREAELQDRAIPKAFQKVLTLLSRCDGWGQVCMEL